MQVKAYGAQAATTPLAPMTIDRREPGQSDVAITVLDCGVCHSDLHTVRAEWHGIRFSAIPIRDIETAYARMLKSVVKYRFVIDMSTL